MRTRKRSSGGRPGLVLALLLVLSAAIAVGGVAAVRMLSGEWWVAGALVASAVVAWVVIAVVTDERASSRVSAADSGGPQPIPARASPSRRSSIA